MMDITECKKELSNYGIELENDMRTLRITARCVPQAMDTSGDNPLDYFIYGGRHQDHNGQWGSPGRLLGALQYYCCPWYVKYVSNPKYQDQEYVDYPDEPMYNDPDSMFLNADIDMDEPDFPADSESWETSHAMGISLGFTAPEEVVVDEDNPYFTARDGVLFSKDMTRLIWYPYGKQAETYVVPNGVTEIGPWAFAGCPHKIKVQRADGSTVQENGKNKYHTKYVYNKSLRRVILPDTLTVIRDDAFNHCLFLTSVRLSSSLREIRWDAFCGCKELRAIELPDSLEYIEPAFKGCDRLEKVRFLGTRHQIARTWETYSGTWNTVKWGPVPYSPDFMGALLKKSWRSENMPQISFETPWFTIADGVMFNQDRTELIWCDSDKSGSYIVPDTVAHIGKRAFKACTQLTQITISHPDTVIGKAAFYGCTNLERVVFQGSGSVKELGTNAFQACYVLQEIQLSQVESIGLRTFCGCEKLRTVQLTKVKFIGDDAFYGCRCLEEIQLTEAEAIGDGAFQECRSIKKIQLTEVKSIGSYAFYRCTHLGPRVTVPESCEYIGEKAFDFCDDLNYLYVPAALANFRYERCGQKGKSYFAHPLSIEKDD